MVLDAETVGEGGGEFEAFFLGGGFGDVEAFLVVKVEGVGGVGGVEFFLVEEDEEGFVGVARGEAIDGGGVVAEDGVGEAGELKDDDFIGIGGTEFFEGGGIVVGGGGSDFGGGVAQGEVGFGLLGEEGGGEG